MKTFKYIELFSGIGGFRSALDAIGGQCVFASEIDKYATQAYRALYGGAPELHGDITKIDAQDIPDHDVLVGGFPCQTFSVAGQRKGFEEARGTLFFEIARIASYKRPAFMLLENVKGLLSHDGGKTFETMCVVLNDIGYAIDFNVLNSKHYGVPQNRERIFIVASRDAEHAQWDVKGNGVVAKAKRRAADLGVRTFNFDWPTNDAVTTRLRDILESNVDERYYLSEEKTAKLVSQLNAEPPRSETDDCDMVGNVDIKGNDSIKRVYSPTGVAPTLTTMGGGHREPKIVVEMSSSDDIDRRFLIDDQGRTTKKLTPLDICPTLRREMHGNEPRVVEPIIEKVGHLPSDSGQTGAVYGTDGIAPTLLNQHGNAVTKVAVVNVGNVNPSGNVMNGNVYADSKAGISDSQRYKQAGNAVSVPVISAIGERLLPLLALKDGEAVAI